MAEQDRFVPGVPNWVDLTTSEPQAAQDFYRGLFGWTFQDAPGPAPGGGRYVLAQVGGGAVGALRQPVPDSTTGWNSYVLVDDVEELAARVRRAGGRVLDEPQDLGLARVLAFADEESAVLHGWEPRGRRGADVVNAHGSVNFNDLHTRDPEVAATFYRAVFGWDRLDVGEGQSMWALTAYGDHLEQRNPGTREQYAGMGGPPGFENVASLDDSGTPAYWGVTFAVDDADACVQTAVELGGRVLAGPFDAPWVRMAVLRDPQGATFTASQFVPPGQ